MTEVVDNRGGKIAMRVERRVPLEGEAITVDLPGERTRGTVYKVVSPDALLVQLSVYTTSREHGKKKGDIIPVINRKNHLGILSWEYVTEHELSASEKPAAEPQLPELEIEGEIAEPVRQMVDGDL